MKKLTDNYWLVVYIFRNSFLGFRRYHGRTSRLEFWLFQLIYGSLLVLLVTANGLLLLLTLVATGVLLPAITACHVRRLHDAEYSGWFLLPKFFYVPWFLFAIRALLQQGTMLNDFLFQSPLLLAIFGNATPVDQVTSQLIIMSLCYAGLIYEIILMVCYCEGGTVGPSPYGPDARIELQNNVKNFMLNRKRK